MSPTANFFQHFGPTEAAVNETKAVSEEHNYNSPTYYAHMQEPKGAEKQQIVNS